MHIEAINYPKFNKAFGAKNAPTTNPLQPSLSKTMQASSLDALSFMGMADVNMSGDEEPKIKRGKPNSIVEEIDETTHRKHISYFDSQGRLDTYEEFAPYSDKVIDFQDKYSYPKKGVIVMNTSVYSNLYEMYEPWEKTTITKDTVAINHLGEADDESGERNKLKIFDKKTFDQYNLPIEQRLKKVSETLYSGEELDENEVLPREFEDDLKCMHKRLVPVSKSEYYDDGTIKKETRFYSTYEHRFPERYEKNYNKNGDLVSKIFIDKFDNPYEVNLYGKCKPFNITEPKGAAAKRANEEVPYNVKIKFVTNKTSDTPRRLGSHYSKQEFPSGIVSSGKVENILFTIGTDMSKTTFELQNWFKRGSKTINIKYTTPLDSTLIFDPADTPFKTFNSIARSNEYYGSNPGVDLSKFYSEFDDELRTEQYLTVRKGEKCRKRYFINPATSMPATFITDGLDDDPFFNKRSQVYEVWKWIQKLEEKYDRK